MFRSRLSPQRFSPQAFAWCGVLTADVRVMADCENDGLQVVMDLLSHLYIYMFKLFYVHGIGKVPSAIV